MRSYRVPFSCGRIGSFVRTDFVPTICEIFCVSGRTWVRVEGEGQRQIHDALNRVCRRMFVVPREDVYRKHYRNLRALLLRCTSPFPVRAVC